MSGKVYFKKSTEELADFVAHMKTQLMSINPEEKKYQKYYNEFFEQYCEEALLHSMTPSGELRANPIAGAVKSQFSFDPIIDEYSKLDANKNKVIKHQVDSAIQNLVSAFMQIRFGLQPKSKDGKLSDLMYKSGEGSEMEAIELNRYFSYMIAGLLYGYLEKFFSQPTQMFEEIFIEMLPKDSNGEVSLRSLRNKQNRKTFAKTFVETGKQIK